MRFAYSFNRRVGAGTDPLLGSDTVPTAPADLAGTNVFKTTVAPSSSSQRVAIGYQYTGAGPAPDLDVKGYVYDGTSETWFTVDSLGVTLTAGDIALLPLLHLIDKPQVAGGDPYASRADSVEFALVITPAGGEPDGTYVFLLGSDISDVQDEASAAPTLPVGAATEAKQDEVKALVGTIRSATTPTKADAATGPIEVDKTGNAYASLTVAHANIVELQGPETDVLTAAEIAAMSVACDGVEANADSVYVYAQLRESPRLVSITPADWTAGTGWAFAGTVATHTPGVGSAGDLEITAECFHIGIPYAVVFAVTMSAGTLTDKLGTAGATARSVTGTYVQILVPTVSGKVIFSADDDSDAAIDIESVWVLPFHELPSAGQEKPLACSKIAAIATKATPTAKVISPATTCLRAVSYRRAGAVQS